MLFKHKSMTNDMYIVQLDDLSWECFTGFVTAHNLLMFISVIVHFSKLMGTFLNLHFQFVIYISKHFALEGTL